MNSDPLSHETIVQLRALLAAGAPAPWRSMVEGRDHESGDSFIMTGEGAGRGEDLYVHASSADQDLIAAARNALPALLDEIERLRASRVAAE